ncbi:MAG: DUF2779 domain-containing protein [Pseudomonadota bacterium]|nr:DUF2779 domain-containing protein [Pseudomonadota bacterium]
MALRQCPRRLWLEVHRPALREEAPASRVRFAIGDMVGVLARDLYDPDENGVLIDVDTLGPEAGVARTQDLLDRRVPLFEAGLEGGGARAFVDVLRPVRRGSQRLWELIEVKSSATPKLSQRDDLAIQCYVATAAGLPLAAIKLAHIDTRFVYRGQDDYRGLLRELDLSVEVRARHDEVAQWVSEGQSVVAQEQEPRRPTGWHCRTPNPCPFLRHCRAGEPALAHSVQLLPRLHAGQRRAIEAQGWRELAELPDAQLTPLQLRVKQHTLAGTVYFDREGAAEDLRACAAPWQFLDFEVVQLAVPQWAGTHPYQMFPFQFSLHVIDHDAPLAHVDHLDLSGAEPARSFAERLLEVCPTRGTVFVWNVEFEQARLRELAERFADLRTALLAISDRMVDLLRITEARYYHPAQRGSWKLKRVLPTLPGALDHADLDGVQDGHAAMLAYIEAIQPDTPDERRERIGRELRDYCRLDTLALVQVWRMLSGSA